jgi:DNA-binding response OmpR family regulator
MAHTICAHLTEDWKQEPMAKVLLIEDDKDLANMVRTYLLFEHHSVESLFDGKQATEYLRCYPYDVIILDWELPGKNGIDVLKDFRENGGTTPILMLTGRTDVAEKEKGLDSGADDYLAKPFEMRELGARVRALLRRPSVTQFNTLTAGDIVLDTAKYRAWKLDKPLALVPKEFKLLEFFMRHPNQVFTPEALLNRVWPTESESTEEALRTAIKRLRKKIDPEGEILRTIHGVGYILEVS